MCPFRRTYQAWRSSLFRVFLTIVAIRFVFVTILWFAFGARSFRFAFGAGVLISLRERCRERVIPLREKS
jgi:hypothetical protein